MNLTELEPVFRGVDVLGVVVRVQDARGACGVSFLCPGCYRHNGGREGTHRISIWTHGAPADLGGPGNARRWSATGTSAQDLTLDPSIDVKTCPRPDGPIKGWHGHIQAGKVTDA